MCTVEISLNIYFLLKLPQVISHIRPFVFLLTNSYWLVAINKNTLYVVLCSKYYTLFWTCDLKRAVQ